MSKVPTTVQKQEAEATEQGEQTERSYASYSDKDLAFDPMRDLNLPKSYEEVVARFGKLQGDRAAEILN